MLADTGGYLGLLLGQSIFGMYQLIVSSTYWGKVSQLLKTRGKLTKPEKVVANVDCSMSDNQRHGLQGELQNPNDEIPSGLASRVVEV